MVYHMKQMADTHPSYAIASCSIAESSQARVPPNQTMPVRPSNLAPNFNLSFGDLVDLKKSPSSSQTVPSATSSELSEPSEPCQSSQSWPQSELAPTTKESVDQVTADITLTKETGKKKSLERSPSFGEKIDIKRSNSHVIQPKNAVQIFNELIESPRFSNFKYYLHNNIIYFEVTVMVEHLSFTGCGPSKSEARQKACENALKHFFVPSLQHYEMIENSSAANAVTEGEDSMSLHDIVPWDTMISYALHKLFSAWKIKDLDIPFDLIIPVADEIRIESEIHSAVEVKSPEKPLKQENPGVYHPVSLLLIMFPNISFLNSVEPDLSGNHTFITKCTLKDKTYVGKGIRKKDAKKNCAQKVLEDIGASYSSE